MKSIRNLTTLTLSAAIASALALSMPAFAEEGDTMHPGKEQQRAGEQQPGDEQQQQRAGERQQDDEQWQAGDQQQDDEQWQAGDQQQKGEQYISAKPAGALYSDDVIGKSVKHRGSGEDIGEIQELVIGEDGRIVGAVVTTGGFLGLGGQDVGLGWDHIEHSMEDDESVFFVDIDEETLRNAPEHERDDD